MHMVLIDQNGCQLVDLLYVEDKSIVPRLCKMAIAIGQQLLGGERENAPG